MLEVVRLSFPEADMPSGIPYLQRYNDHNHARHILARYSEHVKVLPIGKYDLTPPTWTHNIYNRHLRVFEGGIAIYRMDPREEGASTIDVNLGYGVLTDSQRGERVFRLPHDTFSIILGGFSNNNQLRAYEIIHVREAQEA